MGRKRLSLEYHIAVPTQVVLGMQTKHPIVLGKATVRTLVALGLLVQPNQVVTAPTALGKTTVRRLVALALTYHPNRAATTLIDRGETTMLAALLCWHQL